MSRIKIQHGFINHTRVTIYTKIRTDGSQTENDSIKHFLSLHSGSKNKINVSNQSIIGTGTPSRNSCNLHRCGNRKVKLLIDELAITTM